jgi:hypothetical protein
MKKLYTIIAAILLTATTFAQAPEKMSYQAVVRDSGDALVTNQAVGMQISILQTTATGTAVYVETQTPTTNINGLVTLEIGTGTSTDDLTTIDWSSGTYFIKTETDPTGGSSYTITGTSQLLSVPYALHAKTAESLTGNLYDGTTSTFIDISVYGDCSFQFPGCATGNISIVTDTELEYTPGMRIRLSATSDPENNFIEGIVSSYDGSNMDITVDWNRGSSSFSSWNINLGSGKPGVPGAIGEKGPGGFYSGGNLVSVGNSSYTVVGSFIFDGINNFQSIQKAYVRASCNPGTTYDIRLYDFDNLTVIAEITGQSNSSPSIIDLGFLSYNPFSLTSIEIQIRRASGTGSVLFYSALVE